MLPVGSSSLRSLKTAVVHIYHDRTWSQSQSWFVKRVTAHFSLDLPLNKCLARECSSSAHCNQMKAQGFENPDCRTLFLSPAVRVHSIVAETAPQYRREKPFPSVRLNSNSFLKAASNRSLIQTGMLFSRRKLKK